MTTEHILDAIGLLDDDLIQEAERCTAGRRRPNYGIWLGWAASFVLVITLGYWASHMGLMGLGGANSGASNMNQSGGAAENLPSSSPDLSPEGGNSLPGAAGGEENGEAEPNDPGSGAPEEGDYCAAIMVNGTLYYSTGTAIPIEVEESAVRTVTSYTSTVPEMDGQTNFSQDLSARYAVTDQGLVVLIDHAWVLFDPTPPWER